MCVPSLEHVITSQSLQFVRKDITVDTLILRPFQLVFV